MAKAILGSMTKSLKARNCIQAFIPNYQNLSSYEKDKGTEFDSDIKLHRIMWRLQARKRWPTTRN